MKTSSQILNDIKKQLVKFNDEKKDLISDIDYLNNDINEKEKIFNYLKEKLDEISKKKKLGSVLFLFINLLFTLLIVFYALDELVLQIIFTSLLYTSTIFVNITLLKEVINYRFYNNEGIYFEEANKSIVKLEKEIKLNKERIKIKKRRLTDIKYIMKKYTNAILPFLSEDEKKEYSVSDEVKEENEYIKVLHK